MKKHDERETREILGKKITLEASLFLPEALEERKTGLSFVLASP